MFLIALGLLLFYLGRKGVLEALLMIPMGLGMATVNAGVMFFSNYDPASGLTFEALRAAGQAVPAQIPGTLHLAPLAQDTNALMNILQIDWLQPIYTFMFSNGLIACFVFMGIGTLLAVSYTHLDVYKRQKFSGFDRCQRFVTTVLHLELKRHEADTGKGGR